MQSLAQVQRKYSSSTRMSVDYTDLHSFLPPFQPPECGLKIHSRTDSGIYCTKHRYTSDDGGEESSESDPHHAMAGMEGCQLETAPCFVQFEFSVSQVKRIRSETASVTDCPTHL